MQPAVKMMCCWCRKYGSLDSRTRLTKLRETLPGKLVLLGFGRNPQSELTQSICQFQYREQIPGEPKESGVGPDGEVWTVDTSHYGYDYRLYYWDGRDW